MDAHRQSQQPSPREESTKRDFSSESKSKSAVPYNNSLFGRHRMTAAITRLQNEINIIQEELEQLESIGGSSTVCKEFASSVESIPDPLLPETRGPIDVNWDQWFRGAHGGRNHKRWI